MNPIYFHYSNSYHRCAYQHSPSSSRPSSKKGLFSHLNQDPTTRVCKMKKNANKQLTAKNEQRKLMIKHERRHHRESPLPSLVSNILKIFRIHLATNERTYSKRSIQMLTTFVWRTSRVYLRSIAFVRYKRTVLTVTALLENFRFRTYRKMAI